MNRGGRKEKHAKRKDDDFRHSSEAGLVFCRIRPLPADTEKCLRRVDDQTVQLIPPAGHAQSGGLRDMQYKFQCVYDEDVKQTTVFEDVGLPLVEDLIRGRNCLLFVYGNSFTLQGRPDQPGLLPQTLDVLFNTLNGTNSPSKSRRSLLAPKCTFKPDRMNRFDVQSVIDAYREKLERDYGRTASRHVRKSPDEFSGRNVSSGVVGGLDDDCLYSVFVSYVEIYNNYAYDLLQADLGEGHHQTMLRSRLLREDSAGHVYVAGTNEVEVRSADEALRLFSRGQKARHRTAATLSTTDPSRGHGVFNIRVVQAPLDESGAAVVQDKDVVRVSQLSVVDLAEGCKRTNIEGGVGASLLTLRKCLDALGSNQNGKSPVEMVPYRESKLTHLFKSYFEGDGTVRLILCLCPSAEQFEDTAKVLRFAESAQKVHGSQSQRGRFDQLSGTPGRSVPASELKSRAKENVEFVSEEETSRRSRSQYTTFSDDKHRTFPSVKLKGHDDDLTLPALARFLEERIARHKAMSASLKAQDTIFAERLSHLKVDKDDLRKENNALRTRLEEKTSLTNALKRNLAEQTRIREELLRESKLSGQQKVVLMSELYDREHAIEMERQKRQQEKDKIRSLAEKETKRQRKDLEQQKRNLHDNFQQQLRTRERQLRRIHAISSGEMDTIRDADVIPSAPFQSSATSTMTATQHRNATSTHAGHRHAASHDSGHGVTPATGEKCRPPAHNQRFALGRCASKYASYIEHTAKNRTPMGTVLHPRRQLFGRRKSVTQLDLGKTKQCTNYYLEHQEATVDGSVETSILKGDVIPTAGGGRSVIFRDKETLKQSDPTAS